MDFKDFINQDNVVDLAVVVVIVRAIEAAKRKEEAVDTAPDRQAMLASAAARLSDALDRRGL